MTTGRTIEAWKRVYIDGYDMSGYTNDTGEQGIDSNEAPTLCLADAVTGYLPTRPTAILGPITGVFDNTATSGIHVLADAAKGTARKIMIASGVQAAPSFGDDVFCAQMIQKAYKQIGDGGIVSARMDFEHDVQSALLYRQFWGKLLHALGSETDVNSANTNVDNGAASVAGGWLMYQINSITGAGDVSISVEDSANGTTWAKITGADSGQIATASAPIAGIVQLATTATVRRYLRWQIAFGGSATACTFTLGFMRG
jgi:hypothetical protein